jgi:hypothetical protein
MEVLWNDKDEIQAGYGLCNMETTYTTWAPGQQSQCQTYRHYDTQGDAFQTSVAVFWLGILARLFVEREHRDGARRVRDVNAGDY